MGLLKKIISTTETFTTVAQATNGQTFELNGATTIDCVVSATDLGQTGQPFLAAAVNVGANTITITNHGYVTGQAVRISTTGTLPDPLVAATDYFVILVDANTFRLATTLISANEGVPLVLTTQGVGTHTSTNNGVSGRSVALQRSNDGINWSNESTSSSTSANLLKLNASYRYARIRWTVTTGAFSSTVSWLVKGFL